MMQLVTDAWTPSQVSELANADAAFELQRQRLPDNATKSCSPRRLLNCFRQLRQAGLHRGKPACKTPRRDCERQERCTPDEFGAGELAQHLCRLQDDTSTVCQRANLDCETARDVLMHACASSSPAARGSFGRRSRCWRIDPTLFHTLLASRSVPTRLRSAWQHQLAA